MVGVQGPEWRPNQWRPVRGRPLSVGGPRRDGSGPVLSLYPAKQTRMETRQLEASGPPECGGMAVVTVWKHHVRRRGIVGVARAAQAIPKQMPMSRANSIVIHDDPPQLAAERTTNHRRSTRQIRAGRDETVRANFPGPTPLRTRCEPAGRSRTPKGQARLHSLFPILQTIPRKQETPAVPRCQGPGLKFSRV